MESSLVKRNPGKKKERIQLIQEKKFHLAILLHHHSSPLQRGPLPTFSFLIFYVSCFKCSGNRSYGRKAGWAMRGRRNLLKWLEAAREWKDEKYISNQLFSWASCIPVQLLPTKNSVCCAPANELSALGKQEFKHISQKANLFLPYV